MVIAMLEGERARRVIIALYYCMLHVLEASTVVQIVIFGTAFSSSLFVLAGVSEEEL